MQLFPQGRLVGPHCLQQVFAAGAGEAARACFAMARFRDLWRALVSTDWLGLAFGTADEGARGVGADSEKGVAVGTFA